MPKNEQVQADGAEQVEDLEPTDQDAEDLTGGTIHRVPGKYKASE